jgi:hypothetical protein
VLKAGHGLFAQTAQNKSANQQHYDDNQQNKADRASANDDGTPEKRR